MKQKGQQGMASMRQLELVFEKKRVKLMTEKVKIIGHRGFASEYPENSLIGFVKAAELGVEGIELDVHVTKDGEVVVHHDETIDRMTNGNGWIKDKTLAELRTYRLRNGLGIGVTTEQIPTLQEVLALLEDFPDLLINIELKTHIVLYENIEQKVLDLVASFQAEKNIIYSSFHLPTLVRTKRLQAEASVALITQQMLPHLADYMTTFQLDGIHPRKNVYFANENLFHQKSDVRPWTVNSRRDITRLLQSDVSAIITKYPERALAIRRELPLL